jgi:hypothetical protein
VEQAISSPADQTHRRARPTGGRMEHGVTASRAATVRERSELAPTAGIAGQALAVRIRVPSCGSWRTASVRLLTRTVQRKPLTALNRARQQADADLRNDAS